MKNKFSTFHFDKLLIILISIVVFFACKKTDEPVGIVGLCPIVIATDPMHTAVDVVYNKVITITFNEEMNASTINNTSILIKQDSTSTYLSGTVSPTENAAVYTFTPDLPLLPFKNYSGTVAKTVANKFRTNMVSDYVFTFTSIPKLSLIRLPIAGGTTAGGGTFAQNATVTVSATPNAGYSFSNWTDSGAVNVVSTSPNYQYAMAGNRTLVANFKPVVAGNFALNISSNPLAGGTTTGAGAYANGSTVTTTATPNPGYSFSNWTENGNIISLTPIFQIASLTANRNLVANFSIVALSQLSLTLSANPTLGGTTSGGGSFVLGSSVTAVATPRTGYTFLNWTDVATDMVQSTSASYTFVLNKSKTLVANFKINTYTITTTATNGNVVKTPSQLNYNHGTSVLLTATPNVGYTFTSWSGDVTGATNPLSVLMTANKNITANFTAIAPAVNLGSIANFGAYGGNAGITNQGLHTMVNNGGIGTTAASTLITGFHDGLSGSVYTETPLNVGNATGGIFTAPPAPGTAFSNIIATNALADATIAYNSISPASKPGGTDPGAGELGGLTLAPGIYKSAGATFKITNLDLVLDGRGDPNAVWIFQTAAGLTVGTSAAPRSIILTGGALAKNVYWYVGSSAVINYAGGGTMVGTILANSGVTLSSPANSTTTTAQTVLNGRAISLVSSVTMVNTIINNQ